MKATRKLREAARRISNRIGHSNRNESGWIRGWRIKGRAAQKAARIAEGETVSKEEKQSVRYHRDKWTGKQRNGDEINERIKKRDKMKIKDRGENDRGWPMFMTKKPIAKPTKWWLGKSPSGRRGWWFGLGALVAVKSVSSHWSHCSDFEATLKRLV